MNYKKAIVDAGKRMYNSNLTVETWGNISIKDTEKGLIYITPSAMSYEECTEDDVIVCDLEGNIVEGKRKPTVEKDLHLLVYKNRPEINAIVHTHPIYSMIYACLGREIPQVIDEAAQVFGDAVKVAEYALPGSKELAHNCADALGKVSNACLLQSHGAVCLGKDIEKAFKVAKVLEMTAQIYYMAQCIGTPYKISDENISAMLDYAQNHYGQDK
ncbi:MAG: class II aldolase/adducin family protein [Oscillospiraceae bacterium]